MREMTADLQQALSLLFQSAAPGDTIGWARESRAHQLTEDGFPNQHAAVSRLKSMRLGGRSLDG